MATPVTVRIPHALGNDEARRRIAEGFGRIRQQLGGGLTMFVAFEERWEGDRLHFSGGGLGQKITGRIDVFADAVQIQLDLPEMLAALADRITGKLKKEGHLLLEKK
jgi:hypothetical protein